MVSSTLTMLNSSVTELFFNSLKETIALLLTNPFEGRAPGKAGDSDIQRVGDE